MNYLGTMFFLGIAGPFIPYLILTGILVVFTLETSREVMPIREDGSDYLKIQIFQDGPSLSAQGPEFYYFRPGGQHSDHKQAEEHGSPAIGSLRILSPEKYEKDTCNYIFNYSLVLTCCYFGLSPPLALV